MKRNIIPCLLALALAAALVPSALAAPPPSACYPTSVTRSEDGAQIRKVYDLDPKDDPAGIPSRRASATPSPTFSNRRPPSVRSGSTPRPSP